MTILTPLLQNNILTTSMVNSHAVPNCIFHKFEMYHVCDSVIINKYYLIRIQYYHTVFIIMFIMLLLYLLIISYRIYVDYIH